MDGHARFGMALRRNGIAEYRRGVMDRSILPTSVAPTLELLPGRTHGWTAGLDVDGDMTLLDYCTKVEEMSRNRSILGEIETV